MIAHPKAFVKGFLQIFFAFCPDFPMFFQIFSKKRDGQGLYLVFSAVLWYTYP